jgi:hypothetical protein
MKADAVAMKYIPKSMMAQFIVHQRLCERHGQMRCDGDNKK